MISQPHLIAKFEMESLTFNKNNMNSITHHIWSPCLVEAMRRSENCRLVEKRATALHLSHTMFSHNKPDCFVVFNNGIFLFRKFGSTKFYCSVLVVTVYRKSIAEGVFGAKHHSPWPISLSGIVFDSELHIVNICLLIPGLCAAYNAVV